jgi:nicotinate dehydrogenase subunit A
LGNSRQPHPLQRAFIEEQAAQCAYCMNGIIMNAKVLLDKNPSPAEEAIKSALDPVLCRCGSHLRIIRAIKRAARAMRAEGT